MYVDGYVVPVPKASIEAYRKIASTAGQVWMDLGALSYHECVAEDVSVGELTSFPRAVQMKDDETVIFAWVTFASRAERDRINAEVMKDPRLKDMGPDSMPFDGKRMFFGGFESLVDYGP